MAKIEPRIFKGTRDFLPDEMIHREEIQKTMRAVFQKYGFEPMETPAIEYLEVLSGKYGEDADRLIYRLNYKTGTKDEAALHYDLTVPFSRVIAMNKNKMLFPFKRYQIQPVWRADTPQPRQGRFREFYQCDIDAVGSKSMMVDAEIITIVNEILTALKFEGFLIKINNRKILNGIVSYIGLEDSWTGEVCRSIDKLDKVSFEEVAKELSEKGVQADSIQKLAELIQAQTGKNDLAALKEIMKDNESGTQGVAETEELFAYLENLGVPKENVRFELTLARGLDYYTGPIFETTLPAHPHIGSLTGGGRYDNLIGLFSGVEMPAVGTSLGLDRIFAAMLQLGMLSKANTRTKVLVANFSKETTLSNLSLASVLRNAGINSEVYLEPDKLKKQVTFADKKGIPFLVIQGEDEIKNNIVTVKSLRNSTQMTMPMAELVAYLNNEQ